jgi:pimeloyl-ACP methyl ester carboxylesterase
MPRTLSPRTARSPGRREAIALARQALLLRHDTGPRLPPRVQDGDDVVVLLHGLFASAGVLRPLRERIERDAGAHTASFSYLPGPGVRALAARLDALVDQIPKRVRVHLVGHSLGGLVARYYVQCTPHDDRVVQTISIASPFGGTEQARWLPVGVGRDIAQGSPLLELIARTADRTAIPHTAFVAGADTMVVPPESAAFAAADEVLVLEGLGHNAVLYDGDLHDAVVERIRARRLSAA